MPDQPERASRSIHIRTFVAGTLDRERTGRDAAALHKAIGDGLDWIDLTDPDRATLLALADTCALHPLTIDEVFDTHRESDVSIFDGTAHVVLHYPHCDGDQLTFDSHEIQVIIGEGFLISIHRPGVLDVDAVLHHWNATPEHWRSSSGSLLYALLRITVSTFGPVTDRLGDALHDLEETAIDPRNRRSPRRQTLYDLFDLTEQITDLHNIAMPMKDMVQSLMHNSDWFGGQNGNANGSGNGNAYTRDIVDDVVHLEHRLNMLRETGQRLFEMVNSLIMLQRTEVSRQLTIVATIFLPLSYLGAYFGQNFAWMEERVADGGAFALWGVVAPVAALAVILGIMWRLGAFR